MGGVGMIECFYCGEAMGVAVSKKLKDFKDTSDPMPNGVYDMTPCDACKKIMDAGIMLISCEDGEEGKENPYRTGKIVGVRDEAFDGILQKDLLDRIKKARFAFVGESGWEALGLNILMAETDEEKSGPKTTQ